MSVVGRCVLMSLLSCRKAKLQQLSEGEVAHYTGPIFLLSGQLQVGPGGSKVHSSPPAYGSPPPGAAKNPAGLDAAGPGTQVASPQTRAAPLGSEQGAAQPRAQRGSSPASSTGSHSAPAVTEAASPAGSTAAAASPGGAKAGLQHTAFSGGSVSSDEGPVLRAPASHECREAGTTFVCLTAAQVGLHSCRCNCDELSKAHR